MKYFVTVYYIYLRKLQQNFWILYYLWNIYENSESFFLNQKYLGSTYFLAFFKCKQMVEYDKNWLMTSL